MTVVLNRLTNFVIFEGDSITSALGSPPGVDMYPRKALQALDGPPQGRNLARPGSLIRTGAGAPSLVDRLPYVYASMTAGTRAIFVMADGHNDCPAASFQADYSGYIAAVKSNASSRGISLKVIALTVLPSTAPGLQTDIDAANVYIIANSFGADSIVQIHLLANALDASDTDYYSDGTHPTALLHTDLAVPVAAAIDGYLL